MRTLVLFILFIFYGTPALTQSDSQEEKVTYGKCVFSEPNSVQLRRVVEYKDYTKEYPEGMFGESQNKLKISAQNVEFRFMKKKKEMEEYPGKIVEAMAYFEVLVDELSNDPGFAKDLKENLEKGKASFRKAFNFSDDLTTKEAARRFWTLGTVLHQGTMIEQNVDQALTERKTLLVLLNSRLNTLRQQIIFDTSSPESNKKFIEQTKYDFASISQYYDFYAFGHDKKGNCYKGGFNKKGDDVKGSFANYRIPSFCTIRDTFIYVEHKYKEIFEFKCENGLYYQGEWKERNNKITATEFHEVKEKECHKVPTKRELIKRGEKYKGPYRKECKDVNVRKFNDQNTLTLFFADNLQTIEQYELAGNNKIRKFYQSVSDFDSNTYILNTDFVFLRDSPQNNNIYRRQRYLAYNDLGERNRFQINQSLTIDDEEWILVQVMGVGGDKGYGNNISVGWAEKRNFVIDNSPPTKIATTDNSSTFYTVKETVRPHTLPNLQSPTTKIPFFKYVSGRLLKYEITKSKIVNNEEWIFVRRINNFDVSGWTNEKDQFILENSLNSKASSEDTSKNIENIESSTSESAPQGLEDMKTKLLFWKQMFDDGLITQEEYDQKRKEILND